MEAILEALNVFRWNRKEAAKSLNIDYKALLYRMKKLGLDEKSMKATPRYLETAPEVAKGRRKRH